MKLDFLKEFDFFTGVPDSQLRPFCDFLISKYYIDKRHHVIGANEGNCVALAAGYYLATGKVPVVYLQNSGIGNIVNPVTSLLNEAVYGIPCVFVVGWRGEPGVHDEPQHVFQGEVTLDLLKCIGIKPFVITKDTTDEEISEVLNEFKFLLQSGKQVAFVIGKGALEYDEKLEYKNDYSLSREEVISHIINYTDDNPVVSTTGKVSRELFELREKNEQNHNCDFLTVGSMGHASSIALGIANVKGKTKVWCIDGDGALLMHMGAMAIIGSNAPNNLVHILINNCSHETVGGMPTVSSDVDFVGIAKSCGYKNTVVVDNLEDLDLALSSAKKADALTFIEVKTAISSRTDLGRPTTSPTENKNAFMAHIGYI